MMTFVDQLTYLIINKGKGQAYQYTWTNCYTVQNEVLHLQEF